MRTINKAGVDLIKGFEKLELKAYRCPAGVATIGWGHTGVDVHMGQTITLDQAGHLLALDLQRFQAAVGNLAPVATDNQFAALVSFTFNLGEDALKWSTLRRKHNSGDYAGAADEFRKWNKSHVDGKLTELAGLTRRRAEEALLYATP